jgi:hypothetical protein
MSWEQHRYAVERARDHRRKVADSINESEQMVTLQGEANASDAEMLDEVADFLKSLEGGRRDEISGPAFVADWNKMIAEISTFCARYDMPKPDMLFHPKWQGYMSTIAQQRIGSPLIYAGVRVRFGTLRPMDVIISDA